MDLAQFNKLRPKNNSAPEIEAAIGRLQAAAEALETDLAAKQAARPALLLTATNAVVDQHDAEMRSIERDIQRCQSAAEQLKPGLVIALAEERAKEIAALRLTAEQASEAWRLWWSGKYPELARAIAEGLHMEVEANAARVRYYQAVSDAKFAGDAVSNTANLTEMPLGYPNDRARSPGECVCLPAVTDQEQPIFWPAGRFLGLPARVTVGDAYAR